MFGRYLLVQRLSRGGMGEIFLAKHGLAGFEKLAVIKKVLPHLAADAQFISRFVDEAQVAIKLQHVNVAQVFEVGRVGDEYFLALEYIEGRDLRRTIGNLSAKKRRLPVDLALFIGRELANGLAYAHRRTSNDGASLNLVHCDISPPNVLVSFEGETKVIDFGIAKSAIRGTATDPKMGFGKFGYMAPEQLIRGGVVDHRTDIYAAGVVLFELLTGTRLYEAGNEPDYRALARKVSKGEHMLPSEIEPTLAPYDDLVATALRPRPEDRYQSAAELRDAIQQSLVGINPTISTDQLGAFMRDLFADEMTAQRELHERIAQTHIADFQAQLTQQSVSTVSFALNAPLVEPTHTVPAPPRPRRATGAPRPATMPPPLRAQSQSQPPQPPVVAKPALPSAPSAPSEVDDLSLADGTGTADRVSLEMPIADPGRRKRVATMRRARHRRLGRGRARRVDGHARLAAAGALARRLGRRHERRRDHAARGDGRADRRRTAAAHYPARDATRRRGRAGRWQRRSAVQPTIEIDPVEAPTTPAKPHVAVPHHPRATPHGEPHNRAAGGRCHPRRGRREVQRGLARVRDVQGQVRRAARPRMERAHDVRDLQADRDEPRRRHAPDRRVPRQAARIAARAQASL